MLRDNLVGLIEPMRISAGVDPLALIQKQSSDDRSSCIENPRPEGAESSLTENVTSPFQAEPAHIPKGNVYLKTALVEAAHAAAKAKGTYLRDKFYRLKARRGLKRAAVAVAHKILVATYHILSHRVCYNELGDLYLDKLNKHDLTRNLVHRLERLGYNVTLEQKAA